MPAMDKDASYQVSVSLDGTRLDGALREWFDGAPWSRVRTWIHSGKVFVDEKVALDPGRRLLAGERVAVRVNAPRPGAVQRLASNSIVYVDTHVVVVRKPTGVNSIPFEHGERGTLKELVRAWLNRTAAKRRDRNRGELGVVHRIDKETSGLMVFSRTLAAKRSLDEQLRAHSVERRYLALAHGEVKPATITSRLVADRGDGVRGSSSDPKRGRAAVTHITPQERLSKATLVQCQLETGRTHQIRIHLAEAGHPLVGESVYIRGLAGPFVSAPRLMLHAAVLGFAHPADHHPLRFEDEIPNDMRSVIEELRRGRCS